MALSPRINQFSVLGKAFYLSDTIVVPSESASYVVMQSADVTSIEGISIGGSLGDVKFTYFVDGAFTPESQIDTHRYNRTFSPADNDSNLSAWENTSVALEGTNILSFSTFADGTNPRFATPNSIGGSSDFELVLPLNSVFIIKIDNTDINNDAKVNISVQWIEESRKVV